MTLPAAQLGGSSLSFTGLQKVSLVTVGLAEWRAHDGHPLAATASRSTTSAWMFAPTALRRTGLDRDRMKLTGNVVVYVNSVSATLLGGHGLTLGADTPIPTNEKLPSQLLAVNLGLVGVTANSIFFKSSHQFFE